MGSTRWWRSFLSTGPLWAGYPYRSTFFPATEVPAASGTTTVSRAFRLPRTVQRFSPQPKTPCYRMGRLRISNAEAWREFSKFDLPGGTLAGEYLYPVEPVPDVPDPASAYASTGVSEILAIDDQTE